jgi:hypothetical protein
VPFAYTPRFLAIKCSCDTPRPSVCTGLFNTCLFVFFKANVLIIRVKTITIIVKKHEADRPACRQTGLPIGRQGLAGQVRITMRGSFYCRLSYIKTQANSETYFNSAITIFYIISINRFYYTIFITICTETASIRLDRPINTRSKRKS